MKEAGNWVSRQYNRAPWLVVSLGLLAALLVAGGLSSLWQGPRLAPEPGEARDPDPGFTGQRTGLHVVAFYDENQEAPRGEVMDLVEQYSEEITILSPFWYKLNVDGSLIDNSEEDVRQFAREADIPLLPLVTNAEGSDDVLLNEQARDTAIGNILQVVEEKDYAGVSIDFQLLEPGSRDALSAFMAALYPQMQERDKSLQVNVIPMLEADQSSDPYDYAALAENSDRIVLMTYDRHGQKSDPGPVAPLDWVREVIAVALEKTGNDPEQLILGLAAYGYDWVEGSSEDATVMPLKEIRTEDFDIQRSETGEPFYEYTTQDGARHVVWYEDEESIRHKMRLAKENKLHGVAIWRVGYETEAYWQAVREERR